MEGHAYAVDVLYRVVGKSEMTTADLFDLHKLVISDRILDAHKPSGAWKRENNRTNTTVGGRQTMIEYSNHREVPELMKCWFDIRNRELQSSKERQGVLKAYARRYLSFVAIHPFWDGNGRIARLVSNLPCLKAGYPPIIMAKKKRDDYLTALAEYQLAHGLPSLNTVLVQEGALLDRFRTFC